MHSHTFTTLSWYVGTLADIGILFAIWKKGLSEQWPSLFTYCAISLLFDVVLECGHAHYALYFFTYWAWIIISSALRLWILEDVLRSFETPYIQSHLRAFTVTLGSFAAFGCIWFSRLDQATRLPALARFALDFQSAIAVGWVAFIIAGLIGVWLLNLVWTRRGAIIASGVMTKAILNLFAAHLLGGHYLRVATNVISFAAAANLILWLYGLCTWDERVALADSQAALQTPAQSNP